MGYLIFKYALTAAIIVAASEIAKRSDKLGALVLALPLMTVITMFWLFAENQGDEKIANHAWYTFWYAIPTLPMFLLFPWLMGRLGFYAAMGVAFAITALAFVAFAALVRKLGVDLW